MAPQGFVHSGSRPLRASSTQGFVHSGFRPLRVSSTQGFVHSGFRPLRVSSAYFSATDLRFVTERNASSEEPRCLYSTGLRPDTARQKVKTCSASESAAASAALRAAALMSSSSAPVARSWSTASLRAAALATAARLCSACAARSLREAIRQAIRGGD